MPCNSNTTIIAASRVKALPTSPRLGLTETKTSLSSIKCAKVGYAASSIDWEDESQKPKSLPAGLGAGHIGLVALAVLFQTPRLFAMTTLFMPTFAGDLHAKSSMSLLHLANRTIPSSNSYTAPSTMLFYCSIMIWSSANCSPSCLSVGRWQSGFWRKMLQTLGAKALGLRSIICCRVSVTKLVNCTTFRQSRHMQAPSQNIPAVQSRVTSVSAECNDFAVRFWLCQGPCVWWGASVWVPKAGSNALIASRAAYMQDWDQRLTSVVSVGLFPGSWHCVFQGTPMEDYLMKSIRSRASNI